MTTTTDPVRTKHNVALLAASRIAALNDAIAALPYAQAAVARQAGMLPPHLNRILKGKVRYPDDWTLTRIERATQALYALAFPTPQ